MNCDRIARWYRTFEYLVFGRALEQRRLAFLSEIADCRSVLILGDGDGRFTKEFAAIYPTAEVDSVDLSARMIDLARQRLQAIPNQVHLHMGDALTFPLTKRYDLVVTHFFLDCLTDAEVERLVARVRQQCETGALWLVSEFAVPDQGFRKYVAAVFVRFLYFCFALTTGLRVIRLPNYSAVLERHGFRIVARRGALGGLLVSELRRAS